MCCYLEINLAYFSLTCICIVGWDLFLHCLPTHEKPREASRNVSLRNSFVDLERINSSIPWFVLCQSSTNQHHKKMLPSLSQVAIREDFSCWSEFSALARALKGKWQTTSSVNAVWKIMARQGWWPSRWCHWIKIRECFFLWWAVAYFGMLPLPVTTRIPITCLDILSRGIPIFHFCHWNPGKGVRIPTHTCFRIILKKLSHFSWAKTQSKFQQQLVAGNTIHLEHLPYLQLLIATCITKVVLQIPSQVSKTKRNVQYISCLEEYNIRISPSNWS